MRWQSAVAVRRTGFFTGGLHTGGQTMGAKNASRPEVTQKKSSLVSLVPSVPVDHFKAELFPRLLMELTLVWTHRDGSASV